MIMYLIAISVLILDWASKDWALHSLIPQVPFEVNSFFNLYLTFNRGISFSMFQADNNLGVWLLIGISCIICLGILYIFQKEKNKWAQFALMLVFGGAIGNVIDRFRYRVVIDFLDFHFGEYHWPAFNIADSAICIGVAILLWQTLRRKK